MRNEFLNGAIWRFMFEV